MKVLVTGIRGQLGYDVVKTLEARGIEAVGVNSSDMDITDADRVNAVFDEVRPDAVIHCAAWTKVDASEDQVEETRAANVTGTQHIAEAAARLDCKLMYFSTDYVFDGEGERPWEPEDPVAPINVYGQSKLDGELMVRKYVPEKHFILRIQWVYGVNGANFCKTMLRLAKDRDRLTVVSDQIGTPSYTVDIARLCVDMITTEKYGTYHVANQGYCSWYDFACAIFREAGIAIDVAPVSSDQYPAKAKRPHNSRLNTSKVMEMGFEQLPAWQDALHRYLIELGVIG